MKHLFFFLFSPILTILWAHHQNSEIYLMWNLSSRDWICFINTRYEWSLSFYPAPARQDLKQLISTSTECLRYKKYQQWQSLTRTMFTHDKVPNCIKNIKFVFSRFLGQIVFDSVLKDLPLRSARYYKSHLLPFHLMRIQMS